MRTSSTGVISPIISGASQNITAPIRAMMSMPLPTVIQAKLRQSEVRPAPMLCPTRVVAASPIP